MGNAMAVGVALNAALTGAVDLRHCIDSAQVNDDCIHT